MLEIWEFTISSFENDQASLVCPLSPCSLGRRVTAEWKGHWFCATARKIRILQTSCKCSEDPDLEKLTNIYLRICVCVQPSRPINQQDKHTVPRSGMPGAIICVADGSGGKGHVNLVPRGSL